MKSHLVSASRLVLASLAFGVFAASPSIAEDKKDDAKWDVNAPPGLAIREIPISVDEGTWMNVDVSPDGRTIAFDLLGDIYTMPITGGAPMRIAEGLAYETQPRFSPDGKRLSFTSDRGGGDNIWIMNLDGSDKRQLTKEDFRLLNQASWSPNGQFIAAKKHFTTQRSLGTGEVWLYHVSGGAGVPLVKSPAMSTRRNWANPFSRLMASISISPATPRPARFRICARFEQPAVCNRALCHRNRRDRGHRWR